MRAPLAGFALVFLILHSTFVFPGADEAATLITAAPVLDQDS